MYPSLITFNTCKILNPVIAESKLIVQETVIVFRNIFTDHDSYTRHLEVCFLCFKVIFLEASFGIYGIDMKGDSYSRRGKTPVSRRVNLIGGNICSKGPECSCH